MGMTICWNCEHHITAGHTHKDHKAIWYNNFCGAISHDKIIDPVTGIEDYKESQLHPHCKDINPDGKCKLFIPCH